MKPDAGEHVEQFALRAAVAHVIGRDNWHPHRFGERMELAIKPLFVRIEVALKIDI